MFIGCGQARTPERDSSGRYEYFDPQNYVQSDLADEKYECFLDRYYDTLDESKSETKFKAAYNLGKKFYPVFYTNSTDDSTEYFCIAKEDWGYEDESCLSATVVPSAEQKTAIQNDINGAYQY